MEARPLELKELQPEYPEAPADHMQEIDQLRDMPPDDLCALVLMQMKDLSTLRNEVIPDIKSQYGNLAELNEALAKRVVSLENAMLEMVTKNKTEIRHAIGAYDARNDAE
jgi:hypothetical protein